jgi:FAD-linked sulfhydryl oxidase
MDLASWRGLTKKKPDAIATAPSQPISDCPPDVEQLGRSTWTLLHTIAAQYPAAPTLAEQLNAKTFIQSFSKLYPCWHCASDFQAWLKRDSNAPRVSSRDDFGRWLCEAHNAVNVKLGKKTFDCNRWEERWRTGWKDGRCD